MKSLVCCVSLKSVFVADGAWRTQKSVSSHMQLVKVNSKVIETTQMRFGQWAGFIELEC